MTNIKYGSVIQAVNEKAPIFCNAGLSSGPTTISGVSSQIDNSVPDTNSATRLNQPFITFDDVNTGNVMMGSVLPDVGSLPAGAGNSGPGVLSLKQTYQGFCIDSPGVVSKTFLFTVSTA